MKTCCTLKRPAPRHCQCTLAKSDEMFSPRRRQSTFMQLFFVEAIYKSGEVLYIQRAKICHLWSRWQTAVRIPLHLGCGYWMADGAGTERERDCEKIDKQFEIMERKHGFNCNIMHESVSNDAKAAICSMPILLAPLGNLLRRKAERIFQFQTPVVKWHQSLLPSFFNDDVSRPREVHFLPFSEHSIKVCEMKTHKSLNVLILNR